MAEKRYSQSKTQQYLEARKKHNALLSKKPENDEDDGSGGGAGKRKQGDYKLEKLVTKVLQKGLLGAEKFWRFLNKEGLDSHELKKTTLGKQSEKGKQKFKTKEDTKKNHQRSEKSQQSDHLSKLTAKERQTETAKADSAKKQAEMAADTSRQQYGVDEGKISKIVGERLIGKFAAGSVFNGATNPHGFTVQGSIYNNQKSENNLAINNKAVQFSQVKNMTFLNKSTNAAAAPVSINLTNSNQSKFETRVVNTTANQNKFETHTTNTNQNKSESQVTNTNQNKSESQTTNINQNAAVTIDSSTKNIVTNVAINAASFNQSGEGFYSNNSKGNASFLGKAIPAVPVTETPAPVPTNDVATSFRSMGSRGK